MTGKGGLGTNERRPLRERRREGGACVVRSGRGAGVGMLRAISPPYLEDALSVRLSPSTPDTDLPPLRRQHSLERSEIGTTRNLCFQTNRQNRRPQVG